MGLDHVGRAVSSSLLFLVFIVKLIMSATVCCSCRSSCVRAFVCSRGCSGVAGFRGSGAPDAGLMPFLIWGGNSQREPAIYVGGCDDALEWASLHANSIVNCANVDYPWAQDNCSRRWLNLKYKGALNGRTWHQRMQSVTQFCLDALIKNEVVLLHCRVGRHRSGAFCSFLLAFMLGIKYEEGCRIYFRGRTGLSGHDERVVERANVEGQLQQLLDELNSEGFCQAQRSQLFLRRCPPAPKPMPRAGLGSAPVRCGVPGTRTPAQKPMPRPPTSSDGLSSAATDRRGGPTRTRQLDHFESLVDSLSVLPPPPPMPRNPRSRSPPPPMPRNPRSRSRHPPPTRRSGVRVRLQSPPHPPRWHKTAPSPRPPLLRPAPPGYPPPLHKQAPLQPRQPAPPLHPPRRALLRARVIGAASSSSGVPARSESPVSSSSSSPSPEWDMERAWQCPHCDSMNLRSKMFCASRGCEFPRPLLQQFKPGDWFCGECGNHNYKTRVGCNNTHCPTMRYKPGDWVCSRCGNHNYASRSVCNTAFCRMQRPPR